MVAGMREGATHASVLRDMGENKFVYYFRIVIPVARRHSSLLRSFDYWTWEPTGEDWTTSNCEEFAVIWRNDHYEDNCLRSE